MGFEVYDYRVEADQRNLLVRPEIRARLYRMAPGQVDGRHSHDLGHEVFLILEGRAAFEIDGQTQELGPGQMCIAQADQIHQVRNLLPDKPTIMYLSVTPHIQPTHTGRNQADQAEPPNFQPNQNYDVETDLTIPVETLLEGHLAATAHLLDQVQEMARIQNQMAGILRRAKNKGDQAAIVAARNAMWESVYRLHKTVYALDEAWNALAPRMSET